MEAIGPIGGAANRPTPASLVAGPPAFGGAASADAAMTGPSTAITAQAVMLQSSHISMSTVSSRVDTFLAQLGGDLNPFLDMLNISGPLRLVGVAEIVSDPGPADIESQIAIIPATAHGVQEIEPMAGADF